MSGIHGTNDANGAPWCGASGMVPVTVDPANVTCERCLFFYRRSIHDVVCPKCGCGGSRAMLMHSGSCSQCEHPYPFRRFERERVRKELAALEDRANDAINREIFQDPTVPFKDHDSPYAHLDLHIANLPVYVKGEYRGKLKNVWGEMIRLAVEKVRQEKAGEEMPVWLL